MNTIYGLSLYTEEGIDVGLRLSKEECVSKVRLWCRDHEMTVHHMMYVTDWMYNCLSHAETEYACRNGVWYPSDPNSDVERLREGRSQHETSLAILMERMGASWESDDEVIEPCTLSCRCT